MPLLLDACDSARELCRQELSWRIKARVLRVWQPQLEMRSMSYYSLEMILQDVNGDKMHGVVCKNHPLKQAITEGQLYQIYGFRVIWNEGIYSFMGQKVRLLFHTCTMFVPTQDSRCTLEGPSFVDSERILRPRNPSQPLIDIMGILTGASGERVWIKEAVMQKRIAVDLQDLRGSMRVVIIGDYAEYLSNFLCSNWTQRPLIALHLVRVKIEKERIWIYATTPVSTITLNPTFDSALDLIDRLAAVGVRQNEPVEYIWPNENLTHIRDEMLNLYPRKTITQLIETSESGIFVVHAGIVGVIRDGHWSYPSCRCYAEVLGLNGRYECIKCGKMIGKMQRRYRLKLEVFDGYDSSIFVLNDREARQFMKMTCEEFILKLEQSMQDPFDEDYPIELEEKIVGREMLFQVQNDGVYDFNGGECFDVLRICDELQIIDDFHNVQLVVTPKKPKFSVIPETQTNQHTMDNSFAHESSLSISRDDAIMRAPTKRKLMLHLDDENDDEDEGGQTMCPPLKKYTAAYDHLGPRDMVMEYESNFELMNKEEEHVTQAVEGIEVDTDVEIDAEVISSLIVDLNNADKGKGNALRAVQVLDGMKAMSDVEKAAEILASIINDNIAAEKGKGIMQEEAAECSYAAENCGPIVPDGGVPSQISMAEADWCNASIESNIDLFDANDGYVLIEKSEFENSTTGFGVGNLEASHGYDQVGQNAEFDNHFKSSIIEEIKKLGDRLGDETQSDDDEGYVVVPKW